MEQQEIKDNIAQGRWFTDKQSGVETDDYYLFDVQNDDFSIEQDRANASAICHAVNATYGNNINPDKVKEMYDMLQTVLSANGTSEWIHAEITSLLQSATLK